MWVKSCVHRCCCTVVVGVMVTILIGPRWVKRHAIIRSDFFFLPQSLGHNEEKDSTTLFHICYAESMSNQTFVCLFVSNCEKRWYHFLLFAITKVDTKSSLLGTICCPIPELPDAEDYCQIFPHRTFLIKVPYKNLERCNVIERSVIVQFLNISLPDEISWSLSPLRWTNVI